MRIFSDRCDRIFKVLIVRSQLCEILEMMVVAIAYHHTQCKYQKQTSLLNVLNLDSERQTNLC